MSRESFNEGLENPLKKAREAKHPLMRAAWLIVEKARITKLSWAESSREYVNNPENVPEQSGAKRTDARDNLTTNLANTLKSLSWLYFMRFIKASGAISLNVTFSVKYPNKDVDVTIQVFDDSKKMGRKRRVKVKTDNDNKEE